MGHSLLKTELAMQTFPLGTTYLGDPLGVSDGILEMAKTIEMAETIFPRR